MAATPPGSPTERPAKRPKLSFTKTIDVLVGKEVERFIVHTDIIQPRSPFFDAAIKSWKGPNEPIILRDTKPGTFAVYLGCLYHSKVTLHDDDGQYATLSSTSRTYAKLMDLYHLVDSLGDLTACNMTVDRLIKDICSSHDLPPHDLVCRTWANTVASSPLRRLLVDIYIFQLSRKALQLHMEREDVPQDFACALVRKFSRLTEKYPWVDCAVVLKKGIEQGTCEYHDHDAMHDVCGKPPSKSV